MAGKAFFCCCCFSLFCTPTLSFLSVKWEATLHPPRVGLRLRWHKRLGKKNYFKFKISTWAIRPCLVWPQPICLVSSSTLFQLSGSWSSPSCFSFQALFCVLRSSLHLPSLTFSPNSGSPLTDIYTETQSHTHQCGQSVTGPEGIEVEASPGWGGTCLSISAAPASPICWQVRLSLLFIYLF